MPTGTAQDIQWTTAYPTVGQQLAQAHPKPVVAPNRDTEIIDISSGDEQLSPEIIDGNSDDDDPELRLPPMRPPAAPHVSPEVASQLRALAGARGQVGASTVIPTSSPKPKRAPPVLKMTPP
eukprot:TRINITY_DN58938_c0_g2_i1.p1 TRINITY_DN58938_c0_g2~~TRINITY_DN58938_c0_g2_i1.p1  ORF type:complete len:122 (+),score=17.06 TRINITY_DN58938_c0_g2_i1:158-523(+)